MDLDTEHLIYLINSLFMFISFICIFFSSLKIIPKKRIFHYFLSQITLTSSCAYLMQANNVLTITNKHGRAIYNARYIDWIINNPIQLIILSKMGKLSDPNIYALCFLCVMMIASGWVGDFVEGVFKWIFFMMGMTALYPIYVFLFEDFDIHVVREFSGEFIANRFYWMGRALLLIWLLYPVIWVLENTNINLGSNYTSISYTIFDFFSKVLFSFWIFICVQNSPYIGEEIQFLE